MPDEQEIELVLPYRYKIVGYLQNNYFQLVLLLFIVIKKYESLIIFVESWLYMYMYVFRCQWMCKKSCHNYKILNREQNIITFV